MKSIYKYNWPIFKTEMSIYQSKANSDDKILFGKLIHHGDPEIRKMPVWSLYWNQEFHTPFLSMIYCVLISNSMQ